VHLVEVVARFREGAAREHQAFLVGEVPADLALSWTDLEPDHALTTLSDDKSVDPDNRLVAASPIILPRPLSNCESHRS
jgi:hypothetical protein